MKQVINTGLPASSSPLEWATMADITQVLIYVTGAEYLKSVNEIYAQYFEAPFPNCAAMVISALARPDMFVEIIACAHIESEQRVA